MCMATVIFEEKLGKRREGWAVYLNKSQDFTWYSDKQVVGCQRRCDFVVFRRTVNVEKWRVKVYNL